MRGVNVGGRAAVGMADLRAALAGRGHPEAVTHLQSGNVVLVSGRGPEDVGALVREAVADTAGLDVHVMVRTAEELADVVTRNPLAAVVSNPSRYLVSFLAAPLDPSRAEALAAAAEPPEEVVVAGREIYAWHPEGVGRSRLEAAMADDRLGVARTARNWRTVTRLLEIAVGMT